MKRKARKAGATLWMVLLLFMTGILLESCRGEHSGSAQASDGYYTCPMHPDVRKDKPGNCPICGMKLIRVGGQDAENISPDTTWQYLAAPVNRTAVGSFKVIQPTRSGVRDTIRAVGHIGFDLQDYDVVSCRVTGRVDKLFVPYRTQLIRKGQPLMTLYSPGLLHDQRDLLQAVAQGDNQLKARLVARLANLGMDRTEIQEVIRTGTPLESVTIVSPYQGYALQVAGADGSPALASVSDEAELSSLRPGMYVKKGQPVWVVQDTRRVRAILEVAGEELARVHPGDPVTLYAEATPGEHLEGRVDFIPPYRKKTAKTARIRIDLKGLPMGWKIGTPVRGKIAVSQKGLRWCVPLSAVRFLGKRSVVWVQDPAHASVFHVREVQPGVETGDSVRILAGVGAGDRIVENAAYMVDSDCFTD